MFKLAISIAVLTTGCGAQRIGDDTPDGGSSDDTVTVAVPRWEATIDGVSLILRPAIAFGPGERAIGAFTTGFREGPVTAGETTIAGALAAVVVWFDEEGRIQGAQQIADGSNNRGNTELDGTLTVSPSGEVYASGIMYRDVMFFPNTAHASLQSAQLAHVGNQVMVAGDGWTVRYAADRSPSWLVRGTTPPPLEQTWWNYEYALVATPDRGVTSIGAASQGYTLAGFSFPAATLYIAHLTEGGALSWLHTSKNLVFYWNTGSQTVAADGSMYVLARVEDGSGTLAADTASPITITGTDLHILVKISATGDIEWVRGIHQPNLGSVRQLAVLPSGRVAVIGEMSTTLEVTNGANVVASVAGAEQPWLASWTADGTLEWVTLLGEELTLDNTGTLVFTSDGAAHLTATTTITTPQLALDGGPARTLPTLPGTSYTLLYQVDPSGARSRVDVLGTDLPVTSMAVGASGSLAVSACYGNAGSGAGWDALPNIGATTASVTSLPAPAVDYADYYLQLPAPATTN